MTRNFRTCAVLFVLLVTIFTGSATGCASRVVGDADDGGPDGRRDGGAGSVDVPDAQPDVRYRDVPPAYDVFREDACTGDVGPGVRMYDCDPLRSPSGCAPGEGCYPFIEYPEGVCGREVYRAMCMMAGSGPVDSFCTTGMECAPGLTCFVTGSGNRCLRLCNTSGGEPACPRGQVCEPTDLPDIGACD